MQIIRSAGVMQRLALRWRTESIPIGFVPTMGYLHEGHLSLVRKARSLIGPQGKVVVSIYVNPTQFGPREDLAKYPRDFPRDKKLCLSAGVDAVFAPSNAEMYPTTTDEAFSTFVVEEQLSRTMEGASRPTHFRGVTTIVAKLLNLVLPEVAVFGAKDYQQAAVIQRMVRDLNFPVRIVVAPTFREPDGLAMSSRNKYLEGNQRKQALVLWQAIERARELVRTAPGPVRTAWLYKQLRLVIDSASDARLDYIEFFDPRTLQAVELAGRGTQIALAVYIGKTRLIDNARL